MIFGFTSPDDHSAWIFCLGFTRTLLKNGHKVKIFAPKTTHYSTTLEEAGAEFIHVDVDRYMDILKDGKYVATLARLFKEHKLEILINFTTKPNIFGAIAGKIAGVPIIVSAVRGMGRYFIASGSLKTWLLKVMLTTMYRVASLFTTVTWFTNPMDRDLFVSKKITSKKKTLMTKNGLDSSFFSIDAVGKDKVQALRQELGYSDDELVVLMIARMIWPKGVKEFAEASQIVSKEHEHIKFLLVAPYESGTIMAVPEGYLETQELKNFTRLDFRSDIKELCAMCDLGVLPSYYKEGGYPRAVIEPMALGKPAITTDIPECRGALDHGISGYLIPPKDSEALAKAITDILTDEEKRKSFGLRARKKVEDEFDQKYPIASVIKRIEEETGKTILG